MLTFQVFAAPCRVLVIYSAPEDRSPLVPPTTTCWAPRLPAGSHDYLLPPTTTCCLPRLPTASHDYLLAPTTTYCLPRLPAASHDYLLPPTTACGPHDYLLLPTTPALPRHLPPAEKWWYIVARKDDNTTGKGITRERLVREESCASGFLVLVRPIGWASLDEEVREGVNRKVDKVELVRDVCGRL
jgi:hypothetical protein